MKHVRGVVPAIALAGLLALTLAPVTPAQSDADAEDDERHFGLYVEVATGDADADDVDTSIETLSTHLTESYVTLEGQDHGRAALGWRFKDDKGDLRLIFNGYRENGYSVRSEGRLNKTSSGLDTSSPVTWWNLSIVDGLSTATRTPPTWSPANDLDGDGVADANEVQPGVTNRTVIVSGPESLENEVQTIDLVYGREFGTRRVTSHWWAGLRHFSYEGNLTGGAWLATLSPGTGFTDGSLLNPVVFYQQATGMGPTGAWGAEFNFFDRGIQIYLKAQSSFLMNSLETDSGEFFTIVRPTSGGNTFAPARLTEDRDKSSWQNSAEVGVRAIFRNGLQLEAGYSLNGYLDVILRPFDFLIPATANQAPNGTSALYNTQDLRIEGWHAGLSYQF